MREHADIEDLFEKTMAPNYSHSDVPLIHVKMPIDQGDIRPDNIDEW